jgi:hypothetical protein
VTPRELATWHLRLVAEHIRNVRHRIDWALGATPGTKWFDAKCVTGIERAAAHWEARKLIERLAAGEP